MPRPRCIASYSGKSLSGTGAAPLTSSSRKIRSFLHARSIALARRQRVARRNLLESRQLALDLVGERDDCIEPDHLDRARGLVDMRARVLERRQILAGRA